MLLALLVGSALAVDPIHYHALPLPEEDPPVEGQCQSTIPITAGRSLDEVFDIVAEGGMLNAPCSGVLVPTSRAAQLLKTESYAISLSKQYNLDTADLEGEVRVLQAEVDALKADTPWIKSPKGQRWVGRAEVLVVSILVASTAIYVSTRSE